ncbi:MAG: hypothetical protein QM539_02505 [Alphaproteobacteria bacterium]|nr:hypothetical protein [Alphaproteobacteria bacterium]
MLKEFIISLNAILKAHQFIINNKLWRWIIFPGLIYISFLIFGVNTFINTANNFVEWFYTTTNLKSFLLESNNNYLGFILTMESFMVYFTLIFFYFSIIKYLFFLSLSPIFIYFQFRLSNKLNQTISPFTFKRLKSAFQKFFWIWVRLFSLQTFYLGLILIISIIPPIGWFLPVLIILIECYYAGCIIHSFSFAVTEKRLHYINSYFHHFKGISLGNGFVFYMLHIIPILGWMFAPFYALVSSKISIINFNENKPK